jgi:hypothetical protein
LILAIAAGNPRMGMTPNTTTQVNTDAVS